MIFLVHLVLNIYCVLLLGICVDPGVGPKTNTCLVYSFGVSAGWSFEDTFNRYGCLVFSFDPNGKGEKRDAVPGIYVKTTGLGDGTSGGANFMTLADIYERFQAEHGRKQMDVLRIDLKETSGHVLQHLLQSDSLKHVVQLGLRVYFGEGDDLASVRRQMELFQQIERSGFTRFQSRGHLFSPGKILGRNDYLSYEVVWYRTNSYRGFRRLFD